MKRQRIGLSTPALAYLARGLTVLLAVILVWYGLALCLLAMKLSPDTVDSFSGYRTVYQAAARLTTSDFTTGVRELAGAAGLIAFAILLFLAPQEVPRPQLARHELELTGLQPTDAQAGELRMKPRAVERIAEIAAREQRDVAAAQARAGESELTVSITVGRATTLPETLRNVRQNVRAAIERHELPDQQINVTATGFERQTRRELA